MAPLLGGLNHRLLPGSFHLACRSCFSPPTAPPSPTNIVTDFNSPFSFVSLVANDNKGSLSSADFAVRTFNDYMDRNICLERMVGASVIRFGWTIYCLKLEGIDKKGERNVYHAVVQHNLSAKEKRLIKWQLVDKSFHYPSQAIRQNPDFEDNSVCILSVRSDVIVQVDIEACKNSYKYALSAVQIHNNNKDDKICLKELLCTGKLEVDGEVFHFLLLRGVDDYKVVTVYCAIIKVSRLNEEFEELIKWHVVDEFFSKPLQKYREALAQRSSCYRVVMGSSTGSDLLQKCRIMFVYNTLW